MNEPVVTVGGGEPELPLARSDPPKRWLAIGAVGVAAGFLLGMGLRGGTDPTGTVSDLNAVEPPFTVVSTMTTTRREADRLATRVPGFIDDLVVFYSTAVGNTAAAVWSGSSRIPNEVRLPEGPYLADSFHTWLAAITNSRYADGQSLWVGNQAYMEPVATGVLGAVWHSNRAAQLVWTETADDDETLLLWGTFTAGQPSRITKITRMSGIQVPVWWTAAGITVFDGQTLLLLDDSTGQMQAELEADEFVAGSDRYAIVVQGEETVLLNSLLDPVRALSIPSTCRSGSFSPIRSSGPHSVALTCGVGESSQSLQVWAVGSDVEDLLLEVAGSSLVNPAWTPDGAFAILPTIDPVRPSTELTFYTPALDTTYTVTFPGRIFSIEAVTTR